MSFFSLHHFLWIQIITINNIYAILSNVLFGILVFFYATIHKKAAV